jgi:hypothetical protein
MSIRTVFVLVALAAVQAQPPISFNASRPIQVGDRPYYLIPFVVRS